MSGRGRRLGGSNATEPHRSDNSRGVTTVLLRDWPESEQVPIKPGLPSASCRGGGTPGGGNKCERSESSAVSAICAVLTLLAVGVFGVPLGNTPAGATSPQWQTTASFAPLANVRAVSCAPNSGSGPTTCVAVGDNGNNVPSIITSDDGGATWTNDTVPGSTLGFSSGVVPDQLRLLRWWQLLGFWKVKMVEQPGASQIPPFQTFGISCVSATVCTAVGGTSTILKTTDGTSWSPQVSPTGLDSLASVSCTSSTVCVAVGVRNGLPAAVGTQDGTQLDVSSARFRQTHSSPYRALAQQTVLRLEPRAPAVLVHSQQRT